MTVSAYSSPTDHLPRSSDVFVTETDSDAVSGHEDKRQHQNTKSGKKGGRKSSASGTGADDGTPSKPGKEMSKAARRKEQNRAAQKAFRERREARVNDVSNLNLQGVGCN